MWKKLKFPGLTHSRNGNTVDSFFISSLWIRPLSFHFVSLFPHSFLFLPFLSLLSPLSQAKCTLPELRKLYFELKDEIFSTASHSGYNCDTGKLEQLLKKYLGDTMKLSDVDHPKYVDRC